MRLLAAEIDALPLLSSKFRASWRHVSVRAVSNQSTDRRRSFHAATGHSPPAKSTISSADLFFSFSRLLRYIVHTLVVSMHVLVTISRWVALWHKYRPPIFLVFLFIYLNLFTYSI